MQYGNPVPDPVCGRCKKKIDMEVLTEVVYQDGIWFHTACHRAGADQLFRATRLADVLKDIKRGVDIIQSPLFQGDEPPGWHADEGKAMSSPHAQRWLPSAGDHSFLILGNGMIQRSPWNGTDFDQEAWHFGNCFTTHAQAVQARDKLKEVLLSLHQDHT